MAAGDITAPLIPLADLDNKARTVCGKIDIGAYELHPQPSIAFRSTPNPSVGGSTVTFSAKLTGNCNVPTGTLSFYDGTNLLGTSTLDSGASAAFATASLTVGSHNLTATYPGDFNFDPSTSNVVVQVVTGYPSSTTLSVTPNPAGALQAIALSSTVSSQFGTPTGTVSFYAGTNLLTTASVNGGGVASTTIRTLGAGIYSITAVYNASTQFAGSKSRPVIETVTGNPTATILSVKPNPAYVGQTVTMTATVTVTGSQAPSGSVTFYDTMTVLGSVALVPLQTSGSASTATFTTSTLAVGTHPLYASFGSGSVFDGSASLGVDEVILPSNFAIALSPATIALHTGEDAVVSVQLQSLGEFAGPLTLSFGALPTNMTGSVVPGVVTLAGGGSGSAALTLENGEVPVQAASLRSGAKNPREWPTVFAAIALLIVPFRRRHEATILRRPVPLTMAVLCLLQTATGCGNSFYTINAAAPGTYQIPITATDANNNMRTATLTVVVSK